MATPIIESIKNELLTRMQEITVANGYEFTVGAAKYVDRDSNQHQPDVLDIILDLTEVVEDEERSYPGNPPRIAWAATFEITGYHKQLDRDTDQTGIADPGVTDTQMFAAILEAITDNGVSTWHTFGGNAEDASMRRGTNIDGSGHDCVTVELEIRYRTSELNPYSK